MQTSTIKFSQLEDRIDAEYYKPQYLAVVDRVERYKNYKLLGDLTSKIVNGVEIRDYYEKGKPYLRVSDIKELFMDLSDVKKVSESSVITKDVELNEEDLLLSRSGTIGVTAIVNKKLQGSIISSHLIRVVPQNINSFYLAVFLNCGLGKNQILQKNNGAVVPEINQPSLKSIKIPVPPQSLQLQIEKMVKEAEEKRKLTDEKYKEAEEILNKELGLENLDLSVQKTFETKFSETENRFDSEYYQPKYKKTISKLKSYKSKQLDKIVEISKGKIDPNKNPSGKIKYIELANINGSNGMIENCETYKFWQLPGRARMLIKNGDVLVSSLGGSIDKVGFVTKEYDNQVASTGFFIINSNLFTSETLFLLFRNKIISWQLERDTRGAIMSAISESEFRDIIIPILSQPIQQKISKLIQESFRLRKKSKKLIEQAKRKVETSIRNP